MTPEPSCSVSPHATWRLPAGSLKPSCSSGCAERMFSSKHPLTRDLRAPKSLVSGCLDVNIRSAHPLEQLGFREPAGKRHVACGDTLQEGSGVIDDFSAYIAGPL